MRLMIRDILSSDEYMLCVFHLVFAWWSVIQINLH